MLRTNLEVYRTALFVSLGLGVAACGAQAGSESDGGEQENGDDSVLPEHLRCTGGTEGARPGQILCDNGIVHQAVAEADCSGCVPARPELPAQFESCSSDAECGPGVLCIASMEVAFSRDSPCVVSTIERNYFACQRPEDECGADAQCAEPLRCQVSGDRRRCAVVAGSGCPQPGRPFLVDAEVRTASVCANDGWCGTSLGPVPLDAATRAALARHWCEAARLEHASIAAFARFTLQLLELGAPYALVLESQRALLDETEHARLCFELASRYSGEALGPGPLPMEGALESQSLAEILRLVFHEGCIGETSAALQASEALAFATDADVRRALVRVAEDERRHAELAWRFVAWALEQDTSGAALQGLRAELLGLRTRVAKAAQATTLGGGEPELAMDEPLARRHGLLSPEHDRQIWLAALREVVLPCAERLLAAPRGTLRSEPSGVPGASAARPVA
jgi:hypothetical protein